MSTSSFSFVATERGAHVLVEVRSGVEGHRALLGTLVMHSDEWIKLQQALGERGHRHRSQLVTPPPSGPGEMLRRMVVAMAACTRTETLAPSLLTPKPEVIAYASECGRDWAPYSTGLLGGFCVVDVAGVPVTVHDVPDRYQPREIQSCTYCGSTVVAFTSQCVCGVLIDHRLADEDIPF
jgi:hypothetical protein